MIELWMLLRALKLLGNTSNVYYMLMLEDDGILFEMTDRLKKRGVITKTMRYALWEKVSLRSFVGYRSVEGFILIVQTPVLTQDVLESTMSTIIQYPSNYKKDELWQTL